MYEAQSSKWNAENTFDYLGVLSKTGAMLVKNICQLFNIPDKGLAILLDTSNYENAQEHSYWRKLGIHMNIRAGDGEICDVPPTIKEIIDSESFAHLIWLSRRAWDTAEIDLIWNLAHELCHLEQDIKYRFLSLAGTFLYENLAAIDIDEPKITTTVPIELDAELAAWRTVQKLCGKQAADLYICHNSTSGKKQDVFKNLLKHKPDEDYDVVFHTVFLLRKYQVQLDNIINQDPDYYEELDSIDELCRKLEAH